jgi:hypothetical protein
MICSRLQYSDLKKRFHLNASQPIPGHEKDDPDKEQDVEPVKALPEIYVEPVKLVKSYAVNMECHEVEITKKKNPWVSLYIFYRF